MSRKGSRVSENVGTSTTKRKEVKTSSKDKDYTFNILDSEKFFICWFQDLFFIC